MSSAGNAPADGRGGARHRSPAGVCWAFGAGASNGFRHRARSLCRPGRSVRPHRPRTAAILASKVRSKTSRKVVPAKARRWRPGGCGRFYRLAPNMQVFLAIVNTPRLTRHYPVHYRLLWSTHLHRVRELEATGSAGVPRSINMMAQFACAPTLTPLNLRCCRD